MAVTIWRHAAARARARSGSAECRSPSCTVRARHPSSACISADAVGYTYREGPTAATPREWDHDCGQRQQATAASAMWRASRSAAMGEGEVRQKGGGTGAADDRVCSLPTHAHEHTSHCVCHRLGGWLGTLRAYNVLMPGVQ